MNFFPHYRITEEKKEKIDKTKWLHHVEIAEGYGLPKSRPELYTNMEKGNGRPRKRWKDS
jgi:hypothetical protein